MSTNLTERALERLRTKGWTQHHGGPPEGPNCVAGAIEWELAKNEHDEYLEAEFASTLFTELHSIMKAEYPERTNKTTADGHVYGSSIVYFNDHPDTQFADVERVMQKLAAWESEQA